MQLRVIYFRTGRPSGNDNGESSSDDIPAIRAAWITPQKRTPSGSYVWRAFQSRGQA